MLVVELLYCEAIIFKSLDWERDRLRTYYTCCLASRRFRFVDTFRECGLLVCFELLLSCVSLIGFLARGRLPALVALARGVEVKL